MTAPPLARAPAAAAGTAEARRHVERVTLILAELWPLTAPEYDIVAEIAEFVHGTMDRIGASFAEVAPVACRRGCAWCCTVRVTATAPEIFNAAREIRAHHPALGARLVEESRITNGLENAARAELRRWCPLLTAERACAIHACRAVLAPDAAPCREGFEGVRDDSLLFARPLELNAWFGCAVLVALRARGLAAEKYELVQALTIALADDAAEEAWRAGGDPLAPALATHPHERDQLELLAPVIQSLRGAR